MEHRALLAALDGTPERIVACGGGIVERPENRERLAKVPTVFLREDIGILFGRPGTPGAPSGRRAGRVRPSLRAASPLYEEVADLEIVLNGRPPQAVAEEIERWISDA